MFWSFLQHLGTSEEAPFTAFFRVSDARFGIDWCEWLFSVDLQVRVGAHYNS